MPGWTDPLYSTKFLENSGKTGKIQENACDLSNQSSWRTGSRGQIKIQDFQKKFGKNLENFLEKIEKNSSILDCRKPCDRRPLPGELFEIVNFSSKGQQVDHVFRPNWVPS